jgi:hypothetical protein
MVNEKRIINSERMKKTILILVMMVAVVGGCKRERLFNRIYGRHVLTEYTVDGVDSLSLYKDSLGTEFNFYCDDHAEYDYTEIRGYSNVYDEKLVVWDWVIDGNNKNLTIYNSYSLSFGTGPIGKDKKPKWEILKLTNKEFRMKTTYNGKEYEVNLAPN